MKDKIDAYVTHEQKSFLERIVFEDAAHSVGGSGRENSTLGNAVQWCIDACMRIEKFYKMDACSLGYHPDDAVVAIWKELTPDEIEKVKLEII